MHRFFFAAVLVTISGICDAAASPLDRDVVPDAATAIKVGGAILETWMGEKKFTAMIRNAPLRADLDGDTWSVYADRKDAVHIGPESNGEEKVSVVAGGGRPVIELSRHDARVQNIYYSR